MSNFEIYLGILISIISLIFYNHGEYLIYYFIFDLFFFKKKIDIIIHHIIVICMFSIHYFLNIHYTDYVKMFQIIILVEISNIFLLLQKIIDKKYSILKNIINLLFIITFFYYRIYYYYIHCILDNSIIVNTMGKYTNNLFYIKIIFMSFYVINLYWALCIIFIIIRKLLKFNKIKFYGY
jgi:hypothetical protein